MCLFAVINRVTGRKSLQVSNHFPQFLVPRAQQDLFSPHRVLIALDVGQRCLYSVWPCAACCQIPRTSFACISSLGPKAEQEVVNILFCRQWDQGSERLNRSFGRALCETFSCSSFPSSQVFTFSKLILFETHVFCDLLRMVL